MNIRTRWILPLMLAAVCTAQEPAKTQSRVSKPQPPIVTMSFRGGTMAEFVFAVRKAEPKCNIVVAASAADAKVPAMELKQAGLDQVLESACAVASSRSSINCSQSRGNGEPVFAIVARPKGPTMLGSNNDPNTIVLSLNRLTEGDARSDVPGLRIATILSAIEASSLGQESPMLRYHEDSGLLFLRGTNRQLSLASDVLQILERDQKERAKNASALKRSRSSQSDGGGAKSDK